MNLKTYGKIFGVRQILAMAGCWLIALGIGVGLITLVYTLPLEPIQKSVADSVSVFESEGVYPMVWPATLPEHSSTQLDNFTDMLLLNEAACGEEGSPIESAMRVPRVGGSTLDGLREASLGSKPEVDYPRYWHGSLVILKPLLYIGLDYHAIRMMNSIIQIILIIILLSKISKKVSFGVALAFFAGFVAMGFWAIGLSLQYSPVFYVTLIAMLIILNYDNIVSNVRLLMCLMFCIGMATAYVDLLTYPLVSLGFPAILYLVLHKSNNILKNMLCPICLFGLAWCAGYGLMWVSKWVIASLVLQENVIANASTAIQIRTSTNASEISSETISLFGFIKAMTKHLFNPLTMAAVFASVGASTALIVKHFKGDQDTIRYVINQGIPYFVIALAPIIWFGILKNHSYQHNIFTYKILAITIVAILSWLVSSACQVEYYSTESQDSNG